MQEGDIDNNNAVINNQHDNNIANDNIKLKPSLLSIAIKDKKVLYATYMSFVKQGALFIPTKREFNIGDRLSLSITILDGPEKYDIIARVIWVTPKGVHGARAPGVGVQFEGSQAKILDAKIKQILSLDLQNDEQTYTM